MANGFGLANKIYTKKSSCESAAFFMVQNKKRDGLPSLFIYINDILIF